MLRAGGGGSRPRSRALVRRRRSLARCRGRARRVGARGRAGAHRLRHGREAAPRAGSRRGGDRRQPDGRRRLDSATAVNATMPHRPRGRRRPPARADRRRSPGIASPSFGDLIADEFIYGEIARVSREAPVLILDYDSTEIVPGGAGNAASNVAALGGAPSAIGVAGRGRDRPAAARGRSERDVDVRGVVRPARLPHADQDPHPRRRRALGQAAGRPDRSRRRGRSCRTPIAGRSRRGWSGRRARCDALLVSDYGSGLVTPALVAQRAQRVRAARAGARRCWSTRATPCCASAA